jgi:hypothetical protein
VQLVAALGAPDPRAGLVEAERALTDAAAIVPVAWVDDARLVSRRLTGWREDALGDVDYTTISVR